MKLNLYNPGACGVVQMYCVGTVDFNTGGIASGSVIGKLPKNAIILKAIAQVKEPFNAGSSNKISVGFKANKNEVLQDSVITAGTKGNYTKDVFIVAEDTEIYAKYEQTGTPANKGSVDILLEIVVAP